MRRALIVALLMAWGAPSLADDPFRTAAPPAPVVLKPAPRPQPREEPVVAPPSRFSADYVARVKRAVAQQVGVPDSIEFREESTPIQFRPYLGAWGPGNFTPLGLRYFLVVQGVDPDGSVDLIRAWGDSPKGFYKAGSEKLRAKLKDGKLLVHIWYTGTDDPKGHRVEQDFTLAGNDMLHGTSGSNSVDLPRLQ